MICMVLVRFTFYPMKFVAFICAFNKFSSIYCEQFANLSTSRHLDDDYLHYEPWAVRTNFNEGTKSTDNKVAKPEDGLRYIRTASLLLLHECGATAKTV